MKKYLIIALCIVMLIGTFQMPIYAVERNVTVSYDAETGKVFVSGTSDSPVVMIVINSGDTPLTALSDGSLPVALDAAVVADGSFSSEIIMPNDANSGKHSVYLTGDSAINIDEEFIHLNLEMARVPFENTILGEEDDTATADNIKLYVNGTDAQAPVSYDADTKVITIDTTGKLSKYDDAKIVIGSAVTTGVSGSAIGNNIEYSFKVADDNMHYFKLNKNGTETEFVVINGNETALVCTAFLASYADDQFSELSQVISDSINLAKGASYIKKMVASKADNKAMIWSADLTPYVKSK